MKFWTKWVRWLIGSSFQQLQLSTQSFMFLNLSKWLLAFRWFHLFLVTLIFCDFQPRCWTNVSSLKEISPPSKFLFSGRIGQLILQPGRIWNLSCKLFHLHLLGEKQVFIDWEMLLTQLRRIGQEGAQGPGRRIESTRATNGSSEFGRQCLRAQARAEPM
jgi:hypothetical protein